MKTKPTRVVRAHGRRIGPVRASFRGLALALALLSLVVFPAGAAWAGLFNPASFTLANGMQVVVI